MFTGKLRNTAERIFQYMNPSIKKLSKIAQKETRAIIGLMSGTSLDGLDIALCSITGSGNRTKVLLKNFLTRVYDDETRNQLRIISSVEVVKTAEVCRQHTWLAGLHAAFILDALHEWNVHPDEVDCIASHGQTIYHLPARDQKHPYQKPNSTLQIGDGDHIAMKTGIMTISDFRQKHTAAGGEGAPLAEFVDTMLFGSEKETRILLNIGGIGNFTLVPSDKNAHQHSFTTDTGPGNTLIDKLSQAYFNIPFDKDAAIAKTGSVNQKLLGVLRGDDWFSSADSKTTGPEYFSLQWLYERCNEAGFEPDSVKPEDLIRTATELSARTIAESIEKHLFEKNAAVYVSGGGAHNPLLIQRISDLLPLCSMKPFAELGMDPDAKEAVLFAVLANEMLAGNGFNFFNGRNKVNFGKISFPT